MKQRLIHVVIFILMFSVALLVTACDEDSPTKPSDNYGVVAGTVFAPGKSVLPGVSVSIGNQSTITNNDGKFIISGVSPSSRVLVNFAISGRTSSQKVVSVTKGNTTYLSTTLFPIYAANFSAVSPISIDSGIHIEIPASAFETSAGTPFTGTVRAEVHYFDPTLPECLDAFPGSFSGIRTDGSTVMFESYGFVSASFCDALNPDQILSLAEGKEAELTAPIPYALQADAPATMPLWYYDEETGNWREEGVATKVGTTYVGSVTHFSYWNFDHPVLIDDQATITGKVTAADRATPISGAQVVATGVSYAGYTTAYTNNDGEFSISVKANSSLKLQAFAGTSGSQPSATFTSPAGGQSLEVADLEILDHSFYIMGKLVDSAGNPLTGYGQVAQIDTPEGEYGFGAWMQLDDEGNFYSSAQNYGSSTSFKVNFSIMTRGNFFSNAIDFTVPQPGNIYNFGTVTMRPGGIVTGKIKDNDGNLVTNAWLNFRQEGSTGEGGHFSGQIDEAGNFSVAGPPSTLIKNVRAHLWINDQDYQSPLMNLSFPASGSTKNIGTIIVSPAPTP